MKKRLSTLMTLFIALFVSMQSYAQKEQQTLLVGDYDAADTNEAWDGFNLQNAPIVFAYVYSGSQVMYTSEQLSAMKDKEITSLSFKCFAENTYTTYSGSAKLYLQEVDATEFPRNENEKLKWIEFNKDNVIAESVLNLNFMESYGEPLEVTFNFDDKPYTYTGKTLVVTVENTCTGDLPEDARFFWIPSKKEDPWRSIVYGSDDTDFFTSLKKNDYVSTMDNEDKWKNAPVAKFTYQEADAPVDPKPTDGSLTLGHFDDQDTEGAWDGFNLQNAPVIFTYAHSGSQVMYTAEQLAELKGKKLTSMTFKCFPENCYKESYTSTMKMYLQEVDEAEFPYDPTYELYSWIKFDESNAVAEMEFTMNPLEVYNNGTDIEVKFDFTEKPYVYTGKNLVVTIVNDSPEYIDGSEGAIRFYWIDSTKGDPWRSFVFASDDVTFMENQAKDNVLKIMDNEDKWKNAPAVKFTYEDAPEVKDFSGGQGTAADPYLISNVADLEQLNEWANSEKTAGVYFKLTNDITETPFKGMIATTGVFEGIFDGDNHCVAVDADFADLNYVGFIGFMMGATVKNLQVSGNINGGYYVGGVIGQAANGCTIENVINYATVNASMFAGGVIGQLITQDGATGCVATQIANYGTVNAGYSGGVIGDMGQQVGNKVERIANYGHLNADKKSGGLISNARPYDSVYYGFNFGTSENDKPQGCIGNTKSSTIGELYYDSQMFSIANDNTDQSGMTEDFLGSNFMSIEAGSGFSADYWLFADNMYPRLKMNGMENLTIPVLYAAPIVFAQGDSFKNITKSFTVGTENGVVWSSQNGNITFDGAVATPVNAGEDVITATLNGVSRSFNVTVNVNTGICDIVDDGYNSVITSDGSVIITLNDKSSVQIFEVSGRKIMSEVLSEGTYTYSMPAGIYIVRINNDIHKVCSNK